MFIVIQREKWSLIISELISVHFGNCSSKLKNNNSVVCTTTKLDYYVRKSIIDEQVVCGI